MVWTVILGLKWNCCFGYILRTEFCEKCKLKQKRGCKWFDIHFEFMHKCNINIQYSVIAQFDRVLLNCAT